MSWGPGCTDRRAGRPPPWSRSWPIRTAGGMRSWCRPRTRRPPPAGLSPSQPSS